MGQPPIRVFGYKPTPLRARCPSQTAFTRSCKGLVHVKRHLVAHHVETRTGQLVGHRLDGHNAIRFRPLALIERPDLRIETHGKVGRLNKGPGQIFIPVLRVADTLLLAVAEPFALYTATVGGKITHGGEAPEVPGLKHHGQPQYRTDARDTEQRSEFLLESDPRHDG